MANEGLKLLVTADVTQAERALQGFTQTAQTQGAKAGLSFGKGLNEANGSLSALPKIAKPAIKAIADIGDAATNSIVELKQLQKSLKLELGGLSKSQLQGIGGESLRKELSGVTGELKALEKQAGIAGQATGNAFHKSFGVIRQLAYVLPGIGIAGILGAISQGVIGLATALVDSVPSFNQAKAAQEGLADALKSSDYTNAVTNVNRLRVEIDLAKKGFLLKSEVLKDYNNTIGKTTGEVKNLEEAEKALQKNADAYIRFTLLKAAAQLVGQKAAEKLADAEIQNAKDLARISKIKTGQGDVDGIGAFIKSGEENLRRQEQEAAARRVKGLNDISEKFLREAAELSKSFNFNFLEGKGPKDKAPKKVADNIIAEAKRVADYFNDRSIRNVGIEFSPFEKDEAANKAKAREFVKKFQTDFRAAVREFGFDANISPNILMDTNGSEFKKNVEIQGQKAILALQKELDGLKKNSLLLKLDFDLKIEKKRGEEFAEALGIKNINSLLTDAQKQSIALAKSISGILTPAFQDFVGAIISGENPLRAFFQGIGQAVLQLIQKLIAAAIQAAILSALVPGSAGVGGFKSIFKGLVGFAAGGIVSGPTLAMVGEGRGTSRSNPEIIAPLDQLRGMIQGMAGNGGGGGLLTARLRGPDLLLSNARTSRSQSRNGARTRGGGR